MSLPFAALPLSHRSASEAFRCGCCVGGGLLGGVAYPPLRSIEPSSFLLATEAVLLAAYRCRPPRRDCRPLGAGALLDTGWDYRSVMGLLMFGQVIAVILVVVGLPETAQRELEEISGD